VRVETFQGNWTNDCISSEQVKSHMWCSSKSDGWDGYEGELGMVFK
jgi:hypothetical protein